MSFSHKLMKSASNSLQSYFLMLRNESNQIKLLGLGLLQFVSCFIVKCSHVSSCALLPVVSSCVSPCVLISPVCLLTQFLIYLTCSPVLLPRDVRSFASVLCSCSFFISLLDHLFVHYIFGLKLLFMCLSS